uniref:Uncharacterized protein n=1 Tax=uncultured bacterium contig00025 TaxID=1181514 RepID=A0A806K0Y2_9BACT|nr:hypothetical protein [uncultured bacterium contig00025]
MIIAIGKQKLQVFRGCRRRFRFKSLSNNNNEAIFQNFWR